MFARKLRALGHSDPQNFNYNDEKQFQNLVIWLEDTKIRQYKIEDRSALRNTADSSAWQKAFSQYLENVKCTVTPSDRKLVTDWLIGLAIRVVYGDDSEKYSRYTAPPSVQSTSTSNPLDALDMDDPAFVAGIMSLASMLKLPPPTPGEHKTTLKAICILVKQYFSHENISSQRRPTGERASLDDTPLGFSTGDELTDEASKILRMLHIKNLRELQTLINESIVKVQNVTANPKTDQRLGKVGR